MFVQPADGPDYEEVAEALNGVGVGVGAAAGGGGDAPNHYDMEVPGMRSAGTKAARAASAARAAAAAADGATNGTFTFVNGQTHGPMYETVDDAVNGGAAGDAPAEFIYNGGDGPFGGEGGGGAVVYDANNPTAASGSVVYGAADEAATYAEVGAPTTTSTTTNNNVDMYAVSAKRASHTDTEPQYVARDAMDASGNAMYVVAPGGADGQAAPRPVLEEGKGQVLVRPDHLLQGGKQMVCQRPAPSGANCKNKPVPGKQYCRGHCCPEPGCLSSKSSKEGGCSTHQRRRSSAAGAAGAAANAAAQKKQMQKKVSTTSAPRRASGGGSTAANPRHGSAGAGAGGGAAPPLLPKVGRPASGGGNSSTTPGDGGGGGKAREYINVPSGAGGGISRNGRKSSVYNGFDEVVGGDGEEGGGGAGAGESAAAAEAEYVTRADMGVESAMYDVAPHVDEDGPTPRPEMQGGGSEKRAVEIKHQDSGSGLNAEAMEDGGSDDDLDV
jgi:hypothetical protein